MSEEFKYNRRRFLGSAAMTLTATQLGMSVMRSEMRVAFGSLR